MVRQYQYNIVFVIVKVNDDGGDEREEGNRSGKGPNSMDKPLEPSTLILIVLHIIIVYD